MGKRKKQQLSQAEIWDDSALIRSWDDALTEYKVRVDAVAFSTVPFAKGPCSYTTVSMLAANESKMFLETWKLERRALPLVQSPPLALQTKTAMCTVRCWRTGNLWKERPPLYHRMSRQRLKTRLVYVLYLSERWLIRASDHALSQFPPPPASPRSEQRWVPTGSSKYAQCYTWKRYEH